MSRFIKESKLSRDQLREAVRLSWPGELGKVRADAFDAVLNRVLPDYAQAFQITQAEVFRLLEDARGYSPTNYYTDSRLPPSEELQVFETRAELIAAIRPEQGFRCPACGGVSREQSRCDTNIEIDGTACQWSAAGMFSTLGTGVRVVVAEQFRRDGMIHEIFTPVAWETT